MSVLSSIDSAVETVKTPALIVSMAVIHLTYLLIFLGVVSSKHVEGYLTGLDKFVQVFVGFILLFRFNPWTHAVLRPGDKRLLFWCAIFLLTNAGITAYLAAFVSKTTGIKTDFMDQVRL